jgi:ketosteroid isomerase-like protein
MTAPTTAEITTAEIMHRFNEVFQRHDPAALEELVAADCVIENIRPAPDGGRLEGAAACIENWRRIATTPGTGFDLEDTIAFGDRAIILWRYRWSEGEGVQSSVRGVNLMRVRDGRIVEAKGYVKAP